MPPTVKRIGHHRAICEHCNEVLSVEHIVIDCLLYHRERRILKDFMTQKNIRFSLFNLLQDKEEIIVMFMAYLRETGLMTRCHHYI